MIILYKGDKNNYKIICERDKSLIIVTTFEEDLCWYLSVTKSSNLVIEYKYIIIYAGSGKLRTDSSLRL